MQNREDGIRTMLNNRSRHRRIGFHFILVMVLLLNVVPVAAASGGSNFVPWLPTKHYSLDRPVDSTIDNEGNIYIADSTNNRIVKVDRNGMYLTDWGSLGTGDGMFNFPSGIAIDSNSNIYVADRGNNRIQKFDSTGNYITQWGTYGTGDGQFRAPVNLTIDNNGNIYVADRDNYRIQVLDSSGNFLAKWGSYGTGNGQFNIIYGIALDQTGNVYTTESEGHRVQKFTSNGTYITQWGSNGTGDGQFRYPFSIDMDSSGHVYVTDAQNNRIQKFDSNGVYLDQWGSLGTGSGQLNFPNSVSIDPDGSIYVTEAGNNRLQKFDPDGGSLAVLNSASAIVRFNDPSGIAFDSSGSVYVIEKGSHQIQKFNSSGVLLASWGSRGNANGQFEHPTGVVINSTGQIYVTDTGNHRIQKLDRNGSFLGQWGGQGSGDGQFVDPTGIAINANGDIYVVDSGNHRIQRFDAAGNYISQWGSQGRGNGQFESPSRIAIDSNDHIYVTDSGNHRIQQFNRDGSFLGQWGSLGHNNGQLDNPQGIAIDSYGQIYVADSNNNRIQSFTVDGAYVGQWGSTGSGDGQFNNPTAITIDPSGKVNVVDTGNQRIQWKVASPPAPAAPSVTADDEANVIVGLHTTMEFQVDGGSYVKYDGTNAPDLSGNRTVLVRVAADAATGTPAGAATTLTFTTNPPAPAAPSVTADDAANVIVGLNTTMEFQVDGGSYVKYDGTNAPNLSGDHTVLVRVGADSVTGTPAGAATTLTFTTNPPVPAAPSVTADDAANVIVGLHTTMEFQVDGRSYVKYDGTNAPDLSGDHTVLVRVAADAATGTPAGAATTLTFTTNPPAPAAPSVTADDAANAIVGLHTTMEFQVDGGRYVKYDGTNAPDLSGNRTVLVRVAADAATGTPAGAVTTLTFTTNPSAPAAPSVTADDVANVIVGLNTTMEFQVDGGSYLKYDGANAPNLSGDHTVLVRVAVDATTGTPAGAATTLTFTTNPPVPAAPSVTANDAANVIVGLDTTMEFQIDGGSYVKYDGTNAPNLSGDHTVLVRVGADAVTGTPAGAATTLTFTTNPPAPAAPSVTADDAANVIVGLHTTMEFQVDGGSYVKYDGTNAPNLSGDHTVLVRVGADSVTGTPAGAVTTLTFTTNPSAPTAPTLPNVSTSSVVSVLINGKAADIGLATTITVDNRQVTTITIDQKKLEELIGAEGQGAVVTFAVMTKVDVLAFEFNGQLVKNLEKLQAVLDIRTGTTMYKLPARQINIDAISDQVGKSVSLQNIKVKIEIAEPTAAMMNAIDNAAQKGNFTIAAPPVSFTIMSTLGDQAIAIDNFDAYVERAIAIPDEVDLNRVTTGVVIDPDGTVRHVPTKVMKQDGTNYAIINSLTNSTYALVSHPIEFDDVVNHWSKSAVNDMGSRMVIDGTGKGQFSPDRNITRAEFAAILVRGLGLKLESGDSVFTDVKASNWFSSYVNTAYAYKLINGYADGSFGPNDNITREQAMTMIAKAMTITNLKAALPVQSIEVTLHPYADVSKASEWAISSMADSVLSGIVTGRTSTELAPKAFMTRAEVATIIQRLLVKSNFI